MAEFGPFSSVQTWLVFLLIAGIGVLSMLYALACHIRNQTQIHDLRVNVLRVQAAHAARMKELAESGDTTALHSAPIGTTTKADGQPKTNQPIQRIAA